MTELIELIENSDNSNLSFTNTTSNQKSKNNNYKNDDQNDDDDDSNSNSNSKENNNTNTTTSDSDIINISETSNFNIDINKNQILDISSSSESSSIDISNSSNTNNNNNNNRISEEILSPQSHSYEQQMYRYYDNTKKLATSASYTEAPKNRKLTFEVTNSLPITDEDVSIKQQTRTTTLPSTITPSSYSNSTTNNYYLYNNDYLNRNSAANYFRATSRSISLTDHANDRTMLKPESASDRLSFNVGFSDEKSQPVIETSRYLSGTITSQPVHEINTKKCTEIPIEIQYESRNNYITTTNSVNSNSSNTISNSLESNEIINSRVVASHPSNSFTETLTIPLNNNTQITTPYSATATTTITTTQNLVAQKSSDSVVSKIKNWMGIRKSRNSDSNNSLNAPITPTNSQGPSAFANQIETQQENGLKSASRTPISSSTTAMSAAKLMPIAYSKSLHSSEHNSNENISCSPGSTSALSFKAPSLHQISAVHTSEQIKKIKKPNYVPYALEYNNAQVFQGKKKIKNY